MSKKEDFLSVFPKWQDNGSLGFHDAKGKLVAVITPDFQYKSIIDYREHNYIATSPCIYCGCFNDKGHDPLLHVNSGLGIPIDEII